MLRMILVLLSISLSAEAKTIKVVMKSISFDPKVVDAKVGDEIEWENKSYTEHSAKADKGADFDTGMIAPKKSSKKVDLKAPGEIHYHCALHGQTMSGTIKVAP